MEKFDAIVIGAGHAGCEAGLALARMGNKTLLLTISLDAVAFLACNPSIGGTAKGQLVSEIDALGGEMGIIADKTALQIRMLNRGKGPAVQSLRAQADKNAYHMEMKKALEKEKNLTLRQGEVVDISLDGENKNISTKVGLKYEAKAVVLATGVYLESEIIIGKTREKTGPNGFKNSQGLSSSLQRLGLELMRFKTGTPVRVHRRSVDFSKMEEQVGDDVCGFSYLTKGKIENKEKCYLTYTTSKTHEIIRDNLDKAPAISGEIVGVGPRYCPSIETKVVRFADKERHQLFLEPEAENTDEMYLQGFSTSMPADIQKEMVESVIGLENAEIMRDAYAIEYDCINPTELNPTLELKKIKSVRQYAAFVTNEAGINALASGLYYAVRNEQVALAELIYANMPSVFRDAPYVVSNYAHCNLLKGDFRQARELYLSIAPDEKVDGSRTWNEVIESDFESFAERDIEVDQFIKMAQELSLQGWNFS